MKEYYPPPTPHEHDIEKMSNRITNARIEELEKLKERKDELKEKIKEKKDKMKEIRDAMERGDTADMILSSSAAALNKRGKETSNLTNEDLLEIQEMAIERLEEQFSKVEEELKQLKDMESS
ncbi:hypothetical protein G7Y89_g11854 [Cudoniella acicularis]|uniref:Uncharacterized protein n=1 Tax=Cudoniella acicularis TaxID=354080 RepID=A0A8H4VXM0_9HELO|nr:hypothetical protein G7Y89_g11854 [Cudoniella acicularis]